jgi:hypothetical protein
VISYWLIIYVTMFMTVWGIRAIGILRF